MPEDASDIMNKFNEILKNKDSLPDNVKEMLGNLNNNNNSSQNSNNSETSSSDLLKNISPEMISGFMSMLNQNGNNNQSDGNSKSETGSGDNPFGNIDMGTIMKMKSVMDKMNSKDNDPRGSLLTSLKPYLNDNRRVKVDQYIQLFNMTKIMDAFGSNGGEKNK